METIRCGKNDIELILRDDEISFNYLSEDYHIGGQTNLTKELLETILEQIEI